MLCKLRAPQSTDNGYEDTGTEKGDNEAVEIKTVYAALAEYAHNPAADNGPHDSDDNIEQHALFGVGFHNERRDPADDTSEDYPNDDSHNEYVYIR